MLSFTSSLSPKNESFVIFVTENYQFRDKKSILPNQTYKKIHSFLGLLKARKSNEEDIISIDISDEQKCFIIKVKNKHEEYYPQERGGAFFSYIKKFKSIKNTEFYVESLEFDKKK